MSYFDYVEQAEKEIRNDREFDVKAAEEAMVNKDYKRFKDITSGGFFPLPLPYVPSAMQDRGLSATAQLTAIHASIAFVDCGWSAEAMQEYFEEENLDSVKAGIEELAGAGYAEKVYDGEADGAFARYRISLFSNKPETRRYAVNYIAYQFDGEDAKAVRKEIRELIGRDLEENEIMAAYRTWDGKLLDDEPVIVGEDDYEKTHKIYSRIDNADIPCVAIVYTHWGNIIHDSEGEAVL